MTVEERRQALLEWFYADEERSGMQTMDFAVGATYWIVEGMEHRKFLYPPDMTISRHRAFRDLRALERRGDITRGQSNGRATWWHA